MKKQIYLLFIAALTGGCSMMKKTPAVAPVEVVVETNVNPLTNAVDSMSYALGVNVGAGFANDLKNIPGGKSNIDMLIEGFVHALKGDSTRMTREYANTYFRNYLTKEQQKENEQKKIEGEKFLAENKTKEGVFTTESGLQYQILKSTEGEKPDEIDVVKVHYTGTTIDGKVFDSSIERGQPIEFALNNVIKGWSEGVRLMPIGARYKFFIPYNLGYGEQGIPQAGIPPFSPLIFEVELLDIVKKEKEEK